MNTVRHLQEMIEELDAFLARRNREFGLLEAEQSLLYKVREGGFDQVAKNNRDAAARAKLDTTDAQIEDITKKIAHHERYTQQREREMKTRILQVQESAVYALKQQLDQERLHKKQLEDVRIPHLEAELIQCRQDLADTKGKIHATQKEIDAINHLSLDTQE